MSEAEHSLNCWGERRLWEGCKKRNLIPTSWCLNWTFCADLLVAPLAVTIHGAENMLTAFSETNFTCQSTGSRPPPITTWFIGDQRVQSSIESVSFHLKHSSASTFRRRVFICKFCFADFPRRQRLHVRSNVSAQCRRSRQTSQVSSGKFETARVSVGDHLSTATEM